MYRFAIHPTERAQEVSKNLSSMSESEVGKCLQELAENSGPC